MKISATAAFLFLCLLLGGRHAAAQTAAADTVPGQARFVSRVAASLCTRIQEEGRTTKFETLTSKQADDLLLRLMMTSMSDQSTEYAALLSAARRQKLSSDKLGRAVGLEAVKKLSVSCPNSMSLFVRTTSAQKEMGASGAKAFNDVSAEEKAVIQPIADSICVKLRAEDARQPFKQRTAAERTEVITTVMQGTIVKNMAPLMSIYSMEQISNKDSMRAFGIKLASIMMTQCPSYIIMMGEDAKKGKP
ncbi:hypothetical protein MUN81_02925 [Hymenobacter sp. 5317J-9]|uniref:hypothetical protein n=1 Tax=Hymenobacter sp. 5317J-9 TaxID=2932250 RepID=UPI001FD6497F|nr:hypothetical protein [Hymenobacter sp. 5317J-9]UOQ98448.1 hypothetical protein MUN81_02925 [Hymenobacter sp. 5317J-9]